ncbi:prepilin-type N-terminal cleavage/methylation domain-containing protein [Kamptonema cortianum]|nr:prepilin-type N-terminal cleavage/methylation domain-containing protein [Kamptonema cortianum]MDL5049739.1 prepilin-type N-terminal cleavage/methylation domain-containing protein [Oscillatoria amoena NRMC-F 0135]
MNPFSQKRRIKQAFTLIELLVSVSIISVCIAMALGAFYGAYRMMYFTRMLDMSHTEVRNAVDKVSVMARQAIYYPLIYTNGNPATSAPYTNIVGSVTNISMLMRGNEVRIMYRGTIADLPFNLPANSTQITFSNSTTLAPASIHPAVFSQVSPNVSQAAFNSGGGTIFRTQDMTYVPAPGDSVIIQKLGSFPTNILSYLVTNVTQTASTTTLHLSSPTTEDLPAKTVIFVGPQAKMLVQNNTLYFSEKISSTTPSVVLEKIKTSQTPFSMTVPGHTLTVDLRYVADGDITGKGIYRIITRATMRTNPDYRTKKMYPGEGYEAAVPGHEDN